MTTKIILNFLYCKNKIFNAFLDKQQNQILITRLLGIQNTENLTQEIFKKFDETICPQIGRNFFNC
jgi:hypothetical protein